MTEEVHVRVGTPEDLDGVMELAKEVARENGVFKPDLNIVAADIWPALHQNYGIVGIIGDTGKPLEAFVLLRVGQMWYSPEPIIEEKVTFVSKNYRAAKGGRARRLCEFSKKTSDMLGLPLLIGILSNTRTDGKTRLYEREFGPPVGTFFLYNAKTGNWVKEAAE